VGVLEQGSPEGPALVLLHGFLGNKENWHPLLSGLPAYSPDDSAPPLFESLFTAIGEKLLMITSPGSRVRVNGLAAPLVAPLSLGDQIQLDSGGVLHVSRVQRAVPMPPPAELIGKPCEVCLVPFTAETRLLVCPSCGAARHMEGEEVPRDERLECAALGACIRCESDLPQTDGLAFLPED
jgi:hypothetical protein